MSDEKCEVCDEADAEVEMEDMCGCCWNGKQLCPDCERYAYIKGCMW